MRPRGPLDEVRAALADLAGAVRRVRDRGAPRVRVHGAGGSIRAVDPRSREGRELLEAAEDLLEVARHRRRRAR